MKIVNVGYAAVRKILSKRVESYPNGRKLVVAKSSMGRARFSVRTSVEELQKHQEHQNRQFAKATSPIAGPSLESMLLTLFRRLFGRERSTLPPFDFASNRFHMRKKWPPNFDELTKKQQFRFERKFKRRIKDKAIRPEWNRKVTIVIWSLISFVLVYGVLFHDFAKDPWNPKPGEQPFIGLRTWMWNKLGNFYTHTEETMKGGGRGSRRQEPLPLEPQVTASERERVEDQRG
ncbi:hypothetical protein HBH56_169910 [Parastagonospora nodorum]|nr:hypothetical protein HBH56_169910 [Parastagonospora nodorum]KAH3928640.1 hypothetical protein HBH54_138460 [Parastagonospora nodorum]KAH3945423.1 hypothetical protein HBH53_143810 [Parastagonospora nodorum]KAH4003618.1 hypothetical protein HBI10_058400 [Parastagonospora nodorum]KAH4037960.1 hypothetical protein HBI09_061140 [Parastagonospora nodorum]